MSRENRRVLVEAVAHEIRAAQNAVDAFDEAAAALLGINRTDLRCLDILERRGQLTAGELGEAAGLSSGAVTTLLDRLERAGYARRVRDTGDRRRVLVELTAAARRAAGELWGPLGEEARAELERYSDEELAFIRDFHRRGRELNERQIARVQAAGQRPGADRGPG
jgi:DNA-binding MarR family transcriptional regulator